MPNLENLYLNHNLINDSLPLSLCKLKKLAQVDISNNEISGMVQGCLLTSNLILLDLSSNNFSGKFPYSHGNLSGVHMLNLKNARDLNFLNLGRNKFYGNISPYLGR